MSKLSHSSVNNVCPNCGQLVDVFGQFCSDECADYSDMISCTDDAYSKAEYMLAIHGRDVAMERALQWAKEAKWQNRIGAKRFWINVHKYIELIALNS